MKKFILSILFLLQSVGLFLVWKSYKLIEELRIYNLSINTEQGLVTTSSLPYMLYFVALLIAFVSVIAFLFLLYSVIRDKDTLENRKLVLFSITSSIVYLFIIVIYSFINYSF